MITLIQLSIKNLSAVSDRKVQFLKITLFLFAGNVRLAL